MLKNTVPVSSSTLGIFAKVDSRTTSACPECCC